MWGNTRMRVVCPYSYRWLSLSLSGKRAEFRGTGGKRILIILWKKDRRRMMPKEIKTRGKGTSTRKKSEVPLILRWNRGTNCRMVSSSIPCMYLKMLCDVEKWGWTEGAKKEGGDHAAGLFGKTEAETVSTSFLCRKDDEDNNDFVPIIFLFFKK